MEEEESANTIDELNNSDSVEVTAEVSAEAKRNEKELHCTRVRLQKQCDRFLDSLDKSVGISHKIF